MVQQITKGGSRDIFLPPDKNLPLVSIIIATMNAGNYIDGCLKSIISQEFRNVQLLIFDGQSNDNTVNILKQYDQYISYWQSEPDQGIYDAMNKAVTFSKGDWVLFLGSDDRLLDGFSHMCKNLQNKNTLYYGDCEVDQTTKLGGEFSSYKLAKMNICHQALFYPAGVFKKYLYPLQYRVFGDYLLNMQCWGDRSIIKKYVPRCIAIYDMNGFSSNTEDDLFKKDKPLLIKKYLGQLTYLRYLIRKWKESKKPGSKFF